MNDLKPTQKQLDYIEALQEFSKYPLPPFEGITRKEANDYIAKHNELTYKSL